MVEFGENWCEIHRRSYDNECHTCDYEKRLKQANERRKMETNTSQKNEKYIKILEETLLNLWKHSRFNENMFCYQQGVLDFKDFREASKKFLTNGDKIYSKDELEETKAMLQNVLKQDLHEMDLEVLLDTDIT